MTQTAYRVVISGEIDVAPDKREKAVLDAQPLIAAALAEPGCVHYAWTIDPATPGRIHVFEEWSKDEPYLKMAGHLAATGILAAVTRKYRVDIVEPVYDPDGKPRGDFFTAA
jgi:quinol monooxygenase YgiN